MRKWLTGAVLGYFLYGLFVYWYIYMGGPDSIPEQFKGTSADPGTFMNSRELLLSGEYSRLRNFMYFITVPYEWFILLNVLLTGLSRKMEQWSDSIAKPDFLKTSIYLFWLSLIVTVCVLPVEWINYRISLSYQITTQSTTGWMKDQVIDFWVNFLLMALLVSVLFWLIRKYQKRWWLIAWTLSIPFSLFLMFIQPVVIDPLYNDFYPLENKELEEKILALADKADIPAEHVYEVNMSEKTNALNAYVTGIGSNSRIVLWDTTLNRLKEDEILFIMAHEMGHYVMKHIYVGIAGYLLLTLAGLYAIDKLSSAVIRNWGSILKIDSKKQIAALPLILILIGALTFASDPLTNTVSRYQEKSADMYAIQLTNNKEAAVSSFQELSKAGLSQVHPPFLIKLFRYSHPTILERILYLEEYHAEEQLKESQD
ncbi:M48 family metalloprotease [Bacillus lacus]|uniref:M48 family metalloprotease n=1 Tax=Metabacillus lacus TaxID=1983721 RepID=A0A7X2J1D3_9BACI|nr:M48 family metallopeptidase [Metabacillus lacus]MRX73541.1 M48 family metalloprotease [Metabacillus lacus]